MKIKELELDFVEAGSRCSGCLGELSDIDCISVSDQAEEQGLRSCVNYPERKRVIYVEDK